MYSIIIVDDEVDVRQAIIDIIEWDKLGFKLAGEAGNGQEALTLIERTSPDIIITDIKMPYMDGITLAKKIRETNPITKIVFLTGFDDFEYAVSAIKLNVIEYLLKPITAKSFSEMLIKVRKKLDMEQEAAQDLEKLRAQSFDMRRMNSLVSMLTSDIAELNQLDLNKIVTSYKLKLKGKCFLLFAVSIDNETLHKTTIVLDDMELVKFAVTNTIRNISEKYLKGEIFIFGGNIVGIISDEKENIEGYSDIMIQEIYQSIPKFYGFTVTIGVSEKYENIVLTPSAYNRALSAIRYRAVLGSNRAIYFTDVEKGEGYIPLFNDSKDMQFYNLIKTGSKEEAEEFINLLFEELEANKVSSEIYNVYALEIYSTIMRTLRSVFTDKEMEEEIGDFIKFSKGLLNNDLISHKKQIIEFSHKAIDVIGTQRKTRSGRIAEKAYNYIKSNFGDTDISLKKVSEHLHISPNYFSSVFKKETGMSFTDAMTKIRMEAARELLLSTQDKIYEIADKTGYADQHYFSYCFKKYFGSSPNEMRAMTHDWND